MSGSEGIAFKRDTKSEYRGSNTRVRHRTFHLTTCNSLASSNLSVQNGYVGRVDENRRRDRE